MLRLWLTMTGEVASPLARNDGRGKRLLRQSPHGSFLAMTQEIASPLARNDKRWYNKSMTKKALLVILGLLVLALIISWGDLLSAIDPNRRAKILVTEAKNQLLAHPLIGPQSEQFFWYYSSAENNLARVRQISVEGWTIKAQNLTGEDNLKLNNEIREFLIFQGLEIDSYNVDKITNATGYLKNNLACLKTSRPIQITEEQQRFEMKLSCGMLIAKDAGGLN